jgi:hypothetical protein
VVSRMDISKEFALIATVILIVTIAAVAAAAIAPSFTLKATPAESAGVPQTTTNNLQNSAVPNISGTWTVYALETVNGHYLTAVGGGGRTTDVIHTDATAVGSWEQFTLMPVVTLNRQY